MSRSICTVFVALAIFQGAFATNVVNVEPHSVINVKLTKLGSPTIKLFDGERAYLEYVGDLAVGKPSDFDALYTATYIYSNNNVNIAEVDIRLTLPPGAGIINYVSAVNQKGSSAVFCATSRTLGSNEALLKLRVPAKSDSTIAYIIAAH